VTISRMIALTIIILVFKTISFAQWKPDHNLASVKVVEDCQKAKGQIALVTGPPFVPEKIIYYCPKKAEQLDSLYPGAGHFFFVHEFAHHALNRLDERLADSWTVKEFRKVSNGDYYLNAAIKYLKDRGQEMEPRYGTMQERAAYLTKCMTDNGASTKLALNGSNSKRVPVSLRIWPIGIGKKGAEMDVYINGKYVGFISNLLVQETIELGELEPGEHEFRLEKITGYSLDQFGDTTEYAKGLTVRGKFTVKEMRVYKLDIPNLSSNTTNLIASFR
jgi:hypothetical protein